MQHQGGASIFHKSLDTAFGPRIWSIRADRVKKNSHGGPMRAGEVLCLLAALPALFLACGGSGVSPSMPAEPSHVPSLSGLLVSPRTSTQGSGGGTATVGDFRIEASATDALGGNSNTLTGTLSIEGAPSALHSPCLSELQFTPCFGSSRFHRWPDPFLPECAKRDCDDLPAGGLHRGSARRTLQHAC